MVKHSSESQRNRQLRGLQFQDELRRSWHLVPNCWRLRIPDGKGGTRPADELILLNGCNILAEHKRTASDRFELSYLEVNQVKGLVDFDQVIDRNYGLVFVSFLNTAEGRDDAYAFRLITALKFMKDQGRQYITRDELRSAAVPMPALPLDRIVIDNQPGYDLKGVAKCYKLL